MPLRNSTTPFTSLALLYSCLGRLGLSAYIALALFSMPQLLHAESAQSSEYDVKAAFLLNFAQFVSWPENHLRENRIVFGILGDDPFGSALDSMLEGRTVNDRPVTVKRIKRGESILGVDVLFISNSEADQLEKLFAQLRASPTLTVSDIEGFAKIGGMIGFVLRDGRVRFQINHTTGEAAGLTFNAKLLKLAEIPPP